MTIEYELCELLIRNNLKIATAESCTGGLIASRITAVPGASGCFDCGVVTYSNQQKHKLINVSIKTLEEFGAVSEETALEMSAGVKALANADIAISVTGIAGPTGGTLEKPVGTVWIGVCTNSTHNAYKFIFSGNRDEVRSQTTDMAFKLAKDALYKNLK